MPAGRIASYRLMLLDQPWKKGRSIAPLLPFLSFPQHPRRQRCKITRGLHGQVWRALPVRRLGKWLLSGQSLQDKASLVTLRDIGWAELSGEFLRLLPQSISMYLALSLVERSTTEYIHREIPVPMIMSWQAA